ncbi:MAG TPA: CDP-diacylglycerol diphosphatase [Roseiarcus sp.]|nr:CDP-diacylglycerol diphosphatase [Roseiarcus sp.]
MLRPALVAAVALGALLAGRAALADRMALWRIVHDQCVPAADKGAAAPPPCLDVEGATAVIKDRVGVAQLLAIPTARVMGIEDPQLLRAGAPDYFADAWRARALMAAYLKPAPARDDVGIAINSEYARSQDQLHLHVDCLKREVVKALADYAPYLDGEWRPMTVALAGRKYWARRADSTDLAGLDPFRLLADEMPKAKAEMGSWSLAAAPVNFAGRPGFALLADHAELADGGHAEDLQDHDCAIVR